jgi:hypothetical protein
MKNIRMNTPQARAEFERNFNLLHRQIKDGKMHFAPGLLRSVAGLTRIRTLPNGRIDFLSVDEMARLQANMMNQFNESLLEQFQEDQTATDASEDGESPPDSDSLTDKPR